MYVYVSSIIGLKTKTEAICINYYNVHFAQCILFSAETIRLYVNTTVLVTFLNENNSTAFNNRISSNCSYIRNTSIKQYTKLPMSPNQLTVG